MDKGKYEVSSFKNHDSFKNSDSFKNHDSFKNSDSFKNCVSEISSIINKNNGYIKPSDIEKRMVVKEKKLPPLIKVNSFDSENTEALSTVFHMDLEDIINSIKCNYTFLEDFVDNMDTESDTENEYKNKEGDYESSEESEESDNESDESSEVSNFLNKSGEVSDFLNKSGEVSDFLNKSGEVSDFLIESGESGEHCIFIESGDDTPLLYNEKRMRKKVLSYSFAIEYSTLVNLRELVCYMKLINIPRLNTSYIFKGEKYEKERETFEKVMEDLDEIYDYLRYYNQKPNGDRSLKFQMFSKFCEYKETIEYDSNKRFNVNMAVNKIDLIINNVHKNLFLQRYFNRLKVFLYSINDIIV